MNRKNPGAASSRVERDSMGEMSVPAAAYWGASTQRAVINFPISNLRRCPNLARCGPADPARSRGRGGSCGSGRCQEAVLGVVG